MTSTTNFYVTGGTMPAKAPSYIKRQADDELYHALKQGEYCYILDSSQMGKSSLVMQVMEKLKQEGIKVIYFSLQDFGTTAVTLDNWYGSLLTKIDKELELPTTALSFWDNQRQQNLTPTYCWGEVVRQIILGHCSQPIVFFLDEIGMVQSLPAFTDDFLLSLREFYNARTTYPDFRRLTFCLIGTATPASLIKDRHLPSFNVGQRIVLDDFTETEVTSSLADGLQHKATTALTLLQRVWYWTNGHPYLTQKLCEAVANDTAVTTAEGVDKVCQALFLGSRRNKDTNLGQVEDLVKKDPDRPGLLGLYRQIRQQQLPDDDTQEKINALRLTGIITVRDNALWVRNRIYSQVFNEKWINDNMPDVAKAEYRRGLIEGSLAAIVIIGGGIYYYLDGYVWENVTYCNAYAKRFGIMQCVGELSTAQAHEREVSYKFIRKGRKNPVLKKVQAVKRLTALVAHQENRDSNNKLVELTNLQQIGESEFTKKSVGLTNLQQIGEIAATPFIVETLTTVHNVRTYLEETNRWYDSSQQESQWEFVSDANGKIVYEQAYDQDNKLVWGLVYSPSLEGQPKQAHYVGVNGFPQPPTDSGAEFVEFRYSAQGDEEEIRYFDRQDKPQLGPGKVFVKRQRFDGQGLTIEERYFDSDGKKAMLNKDGYHKFTKKYDDRGNVIEEAYLGIDGQPVLSKSISMIGFDKVVFGGYHKITKKYNDRGNISELAYFGIDGQPILMDNSYHKVTKKYDSRGNDNEMAYFGLNGQPILMDNSYHKVTQKYDDSGKVTEKAYFGIDGQPTLFKDGYHKLTKKYDDRDNVIEVAYFGIDGQLTLFKDGYHKFTKNYDDNDKVIEEAYFGIDAQPILLKDGYHKVIKKYDHNYLVDDVIEEAYFGIGGQPILFKDSYHKVTKKYDDRLHVIEWACFGLDGKPAFDKSDGTHKLTKKYDDRGNVIEQANFGIDGQPTLHKDSYHKVTKKYDDRGKVIEEAYFGIDGQPTLFKDGYHKLTYKYDDRGNPIEVAHFGLDGQPILSKDGYHKVIGKYDDRDNFFEVARFGLDGQPILGKDGFHRATFNSDDRGNVTIQASFFGLDGQPILLKNLFHRATFNVDDRGKVIGQAYFGLDGQPILLKNLFHRVAMKYDDRGNVIEGALFGINGQPIHPFYMGDGVYKLTIKYDDRGNAIELALFGIEGQPILGKEGYHKVTWKYDDGGNTVEETYFDVAGNLIHGSSKQTGETVDATGHLKAKGQYNKRGQLISQAYFDELGNPTTLFGLHSFTQKYDEQGDLLEVAYFDIAGRPTLFKDGYHKFTKQKDKSLHQIEWTYFDVEGKPAISKLDGYHKLRQRSDEHGFVIERTYFDITGNYLNEKSDARSNPIYQASFDALGNPTTTSDGFHKLTAKYDDKGNQIEGAYFDVTGQPLTVEVVVKLVTPDSQAEKLGLQAGDIFTHYDSKPVLNLTSFIDRRDAESAEGMAKELKVLREGKELILQVSPGALGVELENRVKSK